MNTPTVYVVAILLLAKSAVAQTPDTTYQKTMRWINASIERTNQNVNMFALEQPDNDLSSPGVTRPVSMSRATNISTVEKSGLFSRATFGRYLANQTLFYLTGQRDVSFYSSYFTANTADGVLTFGRTKTLKDSTTERVYNVLNYGLKTKVADGLGTVFSKGKFSREIGAFVNLTFLGRGRISYYKSAPEEMERERDYIERQVDAELSQESTQFKRVQANALALYRRQRGADVTDFMARQQRDADKFYDELDKRGKDRYFELEEAAGKPKVNYMQTHWWTPRLSATGTTYSLAPDSLTAPADQFFIPVRLGLSFSRFDEDFRPYVRRRMLFTLSADLYNTNVIELHKRYGEEAAARLGMKSVTKDDKSNWQGGYREQWQANVQGRILLTIPDLSNTVSLDVLADLNFGRYMVHDLTFGLLFALPGQDSKKPINIELLGKFADVTGTLLPGLSSFERLQVGLSLALPFNSNLSNL